MIESLSGQRCDASVDVLAVDQTGTPVALEHGLNLRSVRLLADNSEPDHGSIVPVGRGKLRVGDRRVTVDQHHPTSACSTAWLMPSRKREESVTLPLWAGGSQLTAGHPLDSHTSTTRLCKSRPVRPSTSRRLRYLSDTRLSSESRSLRPRSPSRRRTRRVPQPRRRRSRRRPLGSRRRGRL